MTKSVRRFFVPVLVVFLVASVSTFLFARSESASKLSYNGTVIAELETVSSEVALARGLSGREELPKGEGMLFELGEDQQQTCFWMKDMKFSIDIMWLNASKQVVKTMERVSPDTYPESFCSETPVPYVIELPAGGLSESGIKPGARLDW